MRKYRKKRKDRFFILSISLVAVAVLIVITVYSCFSVRKIILNSAKNDASVTSFNIANRVISEQMDEGAVAYNEIVKLTKNEQQNITALEVDIVKINKLKSVISSKISNAITTVPERTVAIPIGTLLGNEYTLGFGPQVKFRMQMSANVITDFESKFYSAGINQVLHQIVIHIKINGNFVLPWNHSGFSSETSIIAAQTVLVGLTPEAYTNVLENYGMEADESRTVDDIFDFGANIN